MQERFERASIHARDKRNRTLGVAIVTEHEMKSCAWHRIPRLRLLMSCSRSSCGRATSHFCADTQFSRSARFLFGKLMFVCCVVSSTRARSVLVLSSCTAYDQPTRDRDAQIRAKARTPRASSLPARPRPSRSSSPCLLPQSCPLLKKRLPPQPAGRSNKLSS